MDDPGLYEECDIDRRGDKESTYVLVLPLGDGLCRRVADRADAMAIARALDDGRAITEIVVARAADPEAAGLAARRKSLADLRRAAYDGMALYLVGGLGPHAQGDTVARDQVLAVADPEIAAIDARLAELESEGRRQSGWYEIVSAKRAAAAAAAATVESAVEGCWAILQALPLREGRKALAALKARVSPPLATSAAEDAR